MSGATEVSLEQRLDLLEQGRVIDREVRTVVERLTERVSVALGRSLDTPTGHMFVTHLAMALTRARAGEALSETPPGLEEELKDRPEEIALATEILAEANNALGLDLPETEVFLVAAYLGALNKGAGL